METQKAGVRSSDQKRAVPTHSSLPVSSSPSQGLLPATGSQGGKSDPAPSSALGNRTLSWSSGAGFRDLGGGHPADACSHSGPLTKNWAPHPYPHSPNALPRCAPGSGENCKASPWSPRPAFSSAQARAPSTSAILVAK